jgi:hypothetical protein
LPASVSSEFGTVTVTVENAAGSIQVKTVSTIDRSRISAKEYPAFRAWCESADRALGQRVVVSK